MNQHESNTNQHESKTGLDQIHKILDQLNHKALLFNKCIYFIKRCGIIYSIYFQERSNVKSIPETQGPLTPGKNKKWFEFQKKRLKTTIVHNLETATWNFLNYFKIWNLRNY